MSTRGSFKKSHQKFTSFKTINAKLFLLGSYKIHSDNKINKNFAAII